MESILIGGPRHGQTQDIEAPYPFLFSVVMVSDDQVQTEIHGLLAMGIEPPVGTWIAHYVRLFEDCEDPVAYGFIAEIGEPEEEVKDG